MVPAPKWIPIGDLTESTKAGSGRVSNMRPTAQEIVSGSLWPVAVLLRLQADGRSVAVSDRCIASVLARM